MGRCKCKWPHAHTELWPAVPTSGISHDEPIWWTRRLCSTKWSATQRPKSGNAIPTAARSTAKWWRRRSFVCSAIISATWPQQRENVVSAASGAAAKPELNKIALHVPTLICELSCPLTVDFGVNALKCSCHSPLVTGLLHVFFFSF